MSSRFAFSAPLIEIVHAFQSNVQQLLPHGDLIIGSDGAFYGTTVYGGAGDTGTIYRVTTSGNYSQLHEFPDTDDFGVNQGGAYPQAGLVLAPDGSYYGTTVYGGAGGGGTVFKLTLNNGAPPTFEVVHEFAARNSDNTNQGGAFPYSAVVVGSDGALYGTTHSGGTGTNGAIFRLTLAGQFTTLHDFGPDGPNVDNADGAHSYFRLTPGPDGNLYGAAGFNGPYSGGTIFRITPSGVFTTLHAFKFLDPSGYMPISVTFGADGALYGLTQRGGSAFQVYTSTGSIFRFTDAGGLETLMRFTQSDGDVQHVPRAAIVQGRDGYWYGTAALPGLIYRFVPNVSYEMIQSFGLGVDLISPVTTLVEMPDNYFYGVAGAGNDPLYQHGAVYRVPRDSTGPLTFSVHPTEISVGQSATLTWSSTFRSCFTNRDWRIAIENSGTHVVTPTEPGSYQYQISCNDHSIYRPVGSKVLWLKVNPAPPTQPTQPTPASPPPSAEQGGGGGTIAYQFAFLLALLALVRARLWPLSRRCTDCAPTHLSAVGIECSV